MTYLHKTFKLGLYRFIMFETGLIIKWKTSLFQFLSFEPQWKKEMRLYMRYSKVNLVIFILALDVLRQIASKQAKGNGKFTPVVMSSHQVFKYY